VTLRVVELFAGVGSQRMALRDEGIDHEVLAIAEIDKHALASYEAIHGDCPNLGDITKVEQLPECDLVTYSFPCQDLSLAGKRAGMGEGTRSGLVWEVVRLLEAAEHRPEWLLMENVPQVLTSPLWPDLLDRLAAMGYRNKFAKLDSSRFGSAQKRVRAFMVSRLDREPPDLPTSTDAPSRCIRDIMEPEVSERYVKRIPLERIKWREPVPGYSNPQSDGLVCPLIDSADPRLETRRIAAERSLSPTLRRGVSVTVVSEDEEERAKGVCGKADNLRMAPKGEKSITTVHGDEAVKVVSPSEVRRREARGETSSAPVAENLDESFYSGRMLYSSSSSSPTVRTYHGHDCQIKVVDRVEPPAVPGRSTPCAEVEGVVYYPERSLYARGGSSPTVCTDHGNNRIQVVDHIEPSSAPIAEDLDETFYSHRMVYSMERASPTVRASIRSWKNVPKVADHIEPASEEEIIAEHFAKAKGPGDRVEHELTPYKRGSVRDSLGIWSVEKDDGHLRFYKGNASKDAVQEMQYYPPGLVSPSVTAVHAPKTLERSVNGDLVVRVLTPRECWRLMGFSDSDYDRAAEVSSETQLYNQAGNSIVVEVLRAIFRAVVEADESPGQTDLRRWLG